MYLISRMEVGPGRTPPEVTRLVARDLGEALTANPQLDIQSFLREEYEGRVPLAAIMKDGRTISTGGAMPSRRRSEGDSVAAEREPRVFRARTGRTRPRHGAASSPTRGRRVCAAAAAIWRRSVDGPGQRASSSSTTCPPAWSLRCRHSLFVSWLQRLPSSESLLVAAGTTVGGAADLRPGAPRGYEAWRMPLDWSAQAT